MAALSASPPHSYDINTASNWDEFFKVSKKKNKMFEAHKTKLFVDKIVSSIAMELELKEVVEKELMVVETETMPCDDGLRGRKTEPIRPGDTILYYNPIYPAGDKRGRTTAVVLSVDPHNKRRVLELTTRDCLDRDTQICRIKIWSRGRSVDNPGAMFGRIGEDFKLNKKVMDEKQRTAIRLEGEGEGEGEGARVKKILKKNMDDFEEKVSERIAAVCKRRLL